MSPIKDYKHVYYAGFLIAVALFSNHQIIFKSVMNGLSNAPKSVFVNLLLQAKDSGLMALATSCGKWEQFKAKPFQKNLPHRKRRGKLLLNFDRIKRLFQPAFRPVIAGEIAPSRIDHSK